MSKLITQSYRRRHALNSNGEIRAITHRIRLFQWASSLFVPTNVLNITKLRFVHVICGYFSHESATWFPSMQTDVSVHQSIHDSNELPINECCWDFHNGKLGVRERWRANTGVFMNSISADELVTEIPNEKLGCHESQGEQKRPKDHFSRRIAQVIVTNFHFIYCR